MTDTTISWTGLTIWPGDGDSPEVFSKRGAALQSKDFKIGSKTADWFTPAEADPDAAAYDEHIITSLGASFSCDGKLRTEDLDFYAAWSLSGAKKNCRVVLEAAATRYFQSAFSMTDFQLKGQQSAGTIEVSMTFKSSGLITKTTGAP
jgi:hypothetical protein